MNPKVREVISRLESSEYAGNTVIFREGDLADNSMYFVISGQVGIFKQRSGQEIELVRMEPGTFFGEMALINTSPRLATTKVVTDKARLAKMNRDTLLRLAGVSPEFVFHLLRQAVSRLLAAEDKLERVREQVQREQAVQRM